MTKSCASGTAKHCTILLPPHEFPCCHRARVLLRFLFGSPALDGCHILPPVLKPSHILAVSCMPWGGQELSKGCRSSARAAGAPGGARGALGGSVQLLGCWGCLWGPCFGGQVCWQQGSAVGWHLTGAGSIQGKGRV